MRMHHDAEKETEISETAYFSVFEYATDGRSLPILVGARPRSTRTFSAAQIEIDQSKKEVSDGSADIKSDEPERRQQA
jgi:hypothetical protein